MSEHLLNRDDVAPCVDQRRRLEVLQIVRADARDVGTNARLLEPTTESIKRRRRTVDQPPLTTPQTSRLDVAGQRVQELIRQDQVPGSTLTRWLTHETSSKTCSSNGTTSGRPCWLMTRAANTRQKGWR